MRRPIGIGQRRHDQGERRRSLNRFEHARAAVRFAEQHQASWPTDADDREGQADRQPDAEQCAGGSTAGLGHRQRDERSETREDRHQKPRRRAGPAPEHVQTRCGPDKRGDGREQHHAQIADIGPPDDQPGPGQGREVDRAVEEEPEFLVEEDAEQSVRDVPCQHIEACIRAVGRLGIEDAVDGIKRIEPEDAGCGHRQEIRPEQARPPPETKTFRGEDDQEHHELGVQPRKDPKHGAA